MAILATATADNSGRSRRSNGKTPGDESHKRKGLIKRLALLKLAWWRIGDDIFAINELIEKCEKKLGTVKEDTERHHNILAYQASLEVRKAELLKRRDRMSSILVRRVLDSLPEKEYQWWRRMEPVAVRKAVPAHLEYWLGSTSGSSVGYERIYRPKLDRNKNIVWRINQGFYFELDGLPENAKDKEFAYSPVMSIEDVEIEVWGMPYTLFREEEVA